MRPLLLAIYCLLCYSTALAQNDDDYQDNTVQIGKAVPGHSYSGTCKIIVPPGRVLTLTFNDDGADQRFPYHVSIGKSLKADGSDADIRASFNGPCDDKAEFDKASPYIIPNRLGTPVAIILVFEDADGECGAKSHIWGAQHVSVTANSEDRDYTIEGTSVRHKSPGGASTLTVTARISNPMDAR